ncbi:MAG: hypothetical protein GY938_19695, partial [Ketobacter sp.]|nr:hypothetical protein [Ketobacter sp.]
IDIDAVRKRDATKDAFGDEPRPKLTPILHRPMLVDAPTAVGWLQYDLADLYGATVDISRIFSMQKDETILYPPEFDKIRARLGNLAYAQASTDAQKKDAQKKDAVVSQSDGDDHSESKSQCAKSASEDEFSDSKSRSVTDESLSQSESYSEVAAEAQISITAKGGWPRVPDRIFHIPRSYPVSYLIKEYLKLLNNAYPKRLHLRDEINAVCNGKTVSHFERVDFCPNRTISMQWRTGMPTLTDTQKWVGPS